MIENGRAVGVETEGALIRARHFVASSLNPTQTFVDLLNEALVPRAMREPGATRSPAPRLINKVAVRTYLRVSTAKQGLSGLGLEAQRAAVESLAQRRLLGPSLRVPRRRWRPPRRAASSSVTRALRRRAFSTARLRVRPAARAARPRSSWPTTSPS